MTPPEAWTGSRDEGADPVGADALDGAAELVDQEIGEGLDAHALPAGGTDRARTA